MTLPESDIELLKAMPIDCGNDHAVTPILNDLERDGLCFHVAGDALSKWRLTDKGRDMLAQVDYAR